MPESHIIYGFAAGEVAPEFYARTDLTKYNLGVSFGKNFFVDYKGGLVSRMGSHYVNRALDPDDTVKLFTFKGLGDDYFLVFGHEYMQVIRSGGLLLEGGINIIGATQANPVEITTDAPHGYSTDDTLFPSNILGMTELNGKHLRITVTGADTFTLQELDGTNVDGTSYSAYVSGGVVNRVFTLVTPYQQEDLAALKGEQRQGKMIFTRNGYSRRELIYNSDTDWDLNIIVSGSTVDMPANLVGTPSSAGSAGAIYTVTAVGQDDSESLPAPYLFMTSIVDFTVTAGSLRINWDPVVGAKYYNVYRSLVMPDDTNLSQAMETGFLGRAIGPQFTDTNIQPDFTKLPPLGYDPFADSSINYIEITAGGSGYNNASTVSITGPGSGFVGYPVVDASGAIIAVNVINGGSGYTAPVVVFAGTGTLAAGTAHTSPANGNAPAVFKVFQQRGVAAGSLNYPMTIEGSKPGELNNNDVSTIRNAGDAYTFTLDQASLTPIKHLVSLRSGLLVFTDTAIEQILAESGKSVTALNALAEPQAYQGASDVSPITIDLDILFTQGLNGSAYAMTFTQYTNAYSLQDLSILSSHLFGRKKQITTMAYMKEPHKLIFCTRSDGTRLLFTYLREQEVFAWTRDYTKGKYQDNVSGIENGKVVIYQVVERNLASGRYKYIERIEPREFDHVEDFWGVDCGLSYPLRKPAAKCTPSAYTGTAIPFSFSADISADISLGDIIYVGGGKAEVVSVDSTVQVTCDILRDIAVVQQEDANFMPHAAIAGEWEVGTPTLTVTGLYHLEGERVSVLADGDSFLNVLVTDGTITLERAATKIIVGIPFSAQMRTLSLTSNAVTVEGKKKDIIGIAPRLNETRGLKIGNSFNPAKLYTMKDRTDEYWGQPIGLRSDQPMRFINKGWDEDGYVYFQQDDPLPASILGYVIKANLGDDN